MPLFLTNGMTNNKKAMHVAASQVHRVDRTQRNMAVMEDRSVKRGRNEVTL